MARTGPRARALLEANCRTIASAIMLELGEAPYAGVPCWTGAERWAHFTVPAAYAARYATAVRPQMPHNPISLKTLLRVAQARARYANHRTGRDSRPTNERLAADTGYSVRTVQRADTALRLLGVATEVLRGRQRTRAERFASWRVGDRARGWASVWALHDDAQLARLIGALSPHPRSGPVRDTSAVSKVVTTGSGSPTGHRKGGAKRHLAPDNRGMALARRWRHDPKCPPWAHRHSAQAWAALLAGPASYGWTPRDLNQLITDWAGVTGRAIPDRPYKPIGLLGAILAWHGTDRLNDRPAAADIAREAAELAAARARVADQLASRDTAAIARALGRAALYGPGHAAARAEAARLRRRAAQRRTAAAATEAAALDTAIRRARS